MALLLTNAQFSEEARHLGGARHDAAPEPAARALASASATFSGSLIAGGSTPDSRPRSANSRSHGEVPITQDVALANPASLVGQKVTARDVLDPDDVHRAVNVDRDLRRRNRRTIGRRAARIARAEHKGRIDDHGRQAPCDQPQRQRLGFVLGIHVRDPVSTRVPDVGLIGRLALDAGPTAATEEVYTTRSTPARNASSSTTRVPSTFS